MRTLMSVAVLAIAAGCAETGSVVKCDVAGASVPQLEAKIRGMMDENMTVGMSVAVVKGDKVVYQQTFGYRDKDTREPLDVNDRHAKDGVTYLPIYAAPAFLEGI